MGITEAVTLALIQGLTEFLPISSSGHLILLPSLFGWGDQGIGFDIAVHLGTLLAVITYFHRQLGAMLRELFVAGSANGRLAWQLVVASIPVGLAGLLFYGLVSTALRVPLVIALASALFGLLLWATDRAGSKTRDEHDLGYGEALLIGAGQALSLIPGTSRSGITMTVALALGLTREAAGRFSFLLAIPAVGMAATYQVLQFLKSPEDVDWALLAVATVIAAVTAFVAIALFLRLIGRIGMAGFAIYRVLLAIVIWYVLL